MIKNILVLLVLAVGFSNGIQRAISENQIKGLKKLLKGLGDGIFVTCNIVLFSEMVNYDEADNRCRNFDIGSGVAEEGNLVTVNDDEKNKDLGILLEMAYPEKDQPSSKWTNTKWVWAGLRKVKNNGYSKKPGKYNSVDWNWSDKSNPKEFNKWMKNQPDQNALKKGKKGCDEARCLQNQMRINHHGQWDDTYKFKLHPYACDYKGKYILSSEPKTWESAKAACSSAGLHLAKVRSGVEVDEMKNAMDYFLGVADPAMKMWNNNNWIWLGGSDMNEEGVWKWLDGDVVEDWNVPWRPKAGKDNAAYLGDADGQHALAISRDGEFDDSFHDSKQRQRPFACQCPGS